MSLPCDVLTSPLFNCEGEVIPEARDEAFLLLFRTIATFVNEEGILQSCVKMADMRPVPRFIAGTPPDATGHNKTTVPCLCVNHEKERIDARISNTRSDKTFKIGDLVVLDPEAFHDIPKTLRHEVGQVGFKIVSLVRKTLTVHRLVCKLGMLVHESAPRKCWKPYVGSEADLIVQTLKTLTHEVTTTSFAPFEFQGVQYTYPTSITLDSVPISRPLLSVLGDRNKLRRRKARTKLPTESRDSRDQQPEQPQPQPQQPVQKRRKMLAKINLDRVPKITSFFSISAAAVE